MTPSDQFESISGRETRRVTQRILAAPAEEAPLSRLDDFRRPDAPAPIATPPASEPTHAQGKAAPVGAHRNPARRRRAWMTKLVVSGLIAMLTSAAAIGGAYVVQEHRLDKNIERFGDPFASLAVEARPKVTVTNAMNILMLGSDSRISAGDPKTWVRGAQRTDSIMIMHIPADRSAITITSIPRDSWVSIPDHGKDKINAAFSLGGPALMINTVENYTGVRIDHMIIVDFDGFKDITDELGGVKITVAKGAKDFPAGPQNMDGATALRYVRQRHDLPDGDFDRVKRQQNWIRAVTLKTLQTNPVTNPLKLNAVLGSLTSSLAVDDGFTIGTMRHLAISLHDVRGSDLSFVTAPVSGTGRSPDGKQAIVNLDGQANQALWTAVANDKLADWLQAHPDAALGSSVR